MNSVATWLAPRVGRRAQSGLFHTGAARRPSLQSPSSPSQPWLFSWQRPRCSTRLPSATAARFRKPGRAQSAGGCPGPGRAGVCVQPPFVGRGVVHQHPGAHRRWFHGHGVRARFAQRPVEPGSAHLRSHPFRSYRATASPKLPPAPETPAPRAWATTSGFPKQPAHPRHGRRG